MAALTRFDPGAPNPVSNTYYDYNLYRHVTRVLTAQTILLADAELDTMHGNSTQLPE